jgi:hypothetical protein
MKFRGGEFSTGTTGNFQPELTTYRSLRFTPFPCFSVRRVKFGSSRLAPCAAAG